MQAAEPLVDFKYLLESGINQLKTEDVKTTQTTNILTFYNELNNLYDDSEPYFDMNPNNDTLDSVPILTIKENKVETLSNQILETYKKTKEIRKKYYRETWDLLHFQFGIFLCTEMVG